VREGRRTQTEIDENLSWQMRHVYPPGYALGTEQEENGAGAVRLSESALARTSRANPRSGPVIRFRFKVWDRSRHSRQQL